MQFTCTRDEFSKGIHAVQRAVASRGPLPILSNIMLVTDGDGLKITATDLEVGIEARVQATIQTAGSITLAARQIAEIISKLPESDVVLAVGEDRASTTVKCARSKFVLRSMPADEFPKLPTLGSGATMVTLAGDELARGIRQTQFAAAKDDKSVISGILLFLEDGQLEVVATDGYRLAMRRWTVDSTASLKVIVPARAMNEVARLLASGGSDVITLATADNQALFTVGDRYLTSRMIDGQYPPYRQILPSTFTYVFTLDRGALQAAVERVSIMASEREAKVVSLVFKAGDLHLLANAADLGEGDEHLPIEYDGEEVKIAFNANYLLDALKAAEGETIQLHMNGPLQPAVLKSEEDATYSCMVMPIRS